MKENPWNNIDLDDYENKGYDDLFEGENEDFDAELGGAETWTQV